MAKRGFIFSEVLLIFSQNLSRKSPTPSYDAGGDGRGVHGDDNDCVLDNDDVPDNGSAHGNDAGYTGVLVHDDAHGDGHIRNGDDATRLRIRQN